MSLRRALGLVSLPLALSSCGDGLVEPHAVDSALLARVSRGAKCFVIGDVSGNDPGRPLGTKQNPFGSLADVQAAEHCKNIQVLYSAVPLDGGITLRERQKLRGSPGPDGGLPIISNTTAANDGRGVVLANRTTVSGLHVTSTLEAGIYGVDVDGVEVRGNELSSFNTGLNIHPQYLLIGNFRFYYGGIHLEGATAGRTQRVSIRDNHLHDAPGVGINVLTLGRASMRIDARGNTLRLLGQHPVNPDPFPLDRPEPVPFSALGNVAMNFGAFDHGTLEVRLDDTLVEDHGPPAGTSGPFMEYDALSAFAGGSADLGVVVDDYTFRDTGVTPRGNRGTQVIQAGADAKADGARFYLEVRDSHFQDPITTHLALTSYYSMRDASVTYVVRNTVMEGTRAAFAPAVSVQHGGFTGLGTPNVGTKLDVVFEGNVVRQRPGSDGDGFNVLNFAGEIGELSVILEGNSLEGAGSTGRGLRFEERGTTLSSVIDAGGGLSVSDDESDDDEDGYDDWDDEDDERDLGSRGRNRIVGFGIDIAAIGYFVLAENNWWGSAAGPANVVKEQGGSVDFEPFLLADPGS